MKRSTLTTPPPPPTSTADVRIALYSIHTRGHPRPVHPAEHPATQTGRTDPAPILSTPLSARRPRGRYHHCAPTPWYLYLILPCPALPCLPCLPCPPCLTSTRPITHYQTNVTSPLGPHTTSRRAYDDRPHTRHTRQTPFCTYSSRSDCAAANPPQESLDLLPLCLDPAAPAVSQCDVAVGKPANSPPHRVSHPLLPCESVISRKGDPERPSAARLCPQLRPPHATE